MSEPQITVQAYHVSSGSNLPVLRLVMHATCPDVGYPDASKPGSASGTAKYFTMPSSGGSAHYIEGVDREEHCVAEDQIAWHAPPNPHSLGIEITADGGGAGSFKVPAHAYTRDQWLSPQVWPAVVRAADRARDICTRYGLPVRRLTVAQVQAGEKGICGHVDVSAAFHQTDHSDPGPNFPWPEFLALVASNQPAPQEDDVLSPEAQTWIEGRIKAYCVFTLANLKATMQRELDARITASGADPAKIAAAVAAALPAESVVSQADIEAALVNVLGSLNDGGK